MKRLFIASLMFVLICIGSYSVAAEDYSYVLPKGYKNYEATGNVMFSIAKDGTCQIMLQKIDNVGKMAKEQLALYTPESMIQVFETGFVNRKYLRSDGSYLELLSDTTAKETSIGKDNYYCIQVDAELADYGYTYSYSDFFARNYYMFSENHTYVLTFQSLNKDYFDSKESLNFLDSFEIKSEKVFNQNDKQESILNSNSPAKEIDTDIKCTIPEGYIEQKANPSYLFYYVKYKNQKSYVIWGFKTHLDGKVTIEDIKSIDTSIASGKQFDSSLKNRKDTSITLKRDSLCIPSNVGRNNYTAYFIDSNYNESSNGATAEVFAHTYAIYSPTDLYTVSVTTTDKEYLWSSECIDFFKSITCKDTTVFTKADEQKIEEQEAPGYHHMTEYPDYIGIYAFLIVLAIVLGLIIKKNGKKIKYLWLIILLFTLGLIGLREQVYYKRIVPISFDTPSIFGYLGYFWIEEIPVLMLLVQAIKSKDKSNVKSYHDKPTNDELGKSYNTINHKSSLMPGMGFQNPIEVSNEEVKLIKDEIPWELQEAEDSENEIAEYDLSDEFKDDYNAIEEVQRIKNGEKGSLSISQITCLITNMSDAKKNLDQSTFNKVYDLFIKLRNCKTKLEMDYKGYLLNAIDIIKRFDNIAPYEKYSGGDEMEYSFLMDEIRSMNNQDNTNISKEIDEYSNEISKKSLGMISDDEAKTFVKILTESPECSKYDTLSKIDTLYKSLNNKYGIFYLIGVLSSNGIINQKEVDNLQCKYKNEILPINEKQQIDGNGEQSNEPEIMDVASESKIIKLDELLEITYNDILNVDGGVKGVVKSVGNLIRNTVIYEEWHVANTKTMHLDSKPKYMEIANKETVLAKIKKLNLDSLAKRHEDSLYGKGFCRLTTIHGKMYDIPFSKLSEKEMNLILEIMNNECTTEVNSKYIDRPPLMDYTRIDLKNKITNLEIIKILLEGQKYNQLFALLSQNCTCYIKEESLKLLGERDIKKYIKKTISRIKHEFKDKLRASICGFYNINEPDIMLEIYHYLPGSTETRKRFVQFEFESDKIISVVVLDDTKVINKNINEKAIELLKKGKLNEFDEDIANEVKGNNITWDEFLDKNFSWSKGKKTYFSKKD